MVAFIFDMDGVIVDSNPVHEVALKKFCRKYGHHLSDEELRVKIFGRRNEDWLKAVFGALDPKDLKKYADEKEELFRELYKDDIKPLEGLHSFLQKLEERQIPRAIATSAPAENVDFVVGKTGIGRYFETILDSSFVTQGKPHPQIYLRTAEALAFKPENCVVFEDSLAGVASARSAGCKVIAVTTTHERGEFEGTDMVIDNFTGLEPQNLIRELFG